MNKSEAREVAKAKKLAKAGELRQAAVTLATIHRAALRNKTRGEIEAVLHAEGLTNFLKMVNGCLVPAWN